VQEDSRQGLTIATSIAAYWLSRDAMGEMAARSLSIIIIPAATHDHS